MSLFFKHTDGKRSQSTDRDELHYSAKRKKAKLKITYIQVIVMVFLAIIITGTLLLLLPFATKANQETSFVGALFTATSATCVTGLVVYDTYTHWTVFGQAIILLMIQVGGLGFMSVATMFSLALKRKIGLRERELIQEAISTLHIGGIVRLMRFAVFGTFMIEGIGAVLLAVRFIPQMGMVRGIWNGIFHSVSAFCNAGFDLFGGNGAFSSLTSYYNDFYLNVVIMLLIIIGGIGFLVWEDIYNNGLHFKKFKLHSKIVLVTTFALLLGGFAAYYIFERNYSLAGMSEGEKVLCSAFQSVTFRTAGFVTADLAKMSPSMIVIACLLMLVGGSPGSTAGGIKTTTLAIVILGSRSVIRRKKSIQVFNRRIENDLMKKAFSVVAVYMLVAITAIVFICALENISLEIAMLEVFSAVGTVGLSMGLTPNLSCVSKLLVAVLMFFGRIGGLSMVLAFTRRASNAEIEAPIEKISV